MIDTYTTPEQMYEADKEALTHEALELADLAQRTSRAAELGHGAMSERQVATPSFSTNESSNFKPEASPEQLANQNLLAMTALIGAWLARVRQDEVQSSDDRAA